MRKDPAFLFYSSDFLFGTLHMSFEDRGKYITLLCYMHGSGRLSEETVLHIAGNISPMLQSKFLTDENGLWYNARLEEEVSKRKKYSCSRTENGRKGGRPVKVTIEQVPVDSAPIALPENESFKKFWAIYDKPFDKESCELKWNELTADEKRIIHQRLPAYVKATPEKRYRKNPLTYLSRKAWLEEPVNLFQKQNTKSAIELLAETGIYS
jgi:hypothetical protein